MKADVAEELRELCKENAPFKKLLAQAELDKAMLNELNRGTSDPGLPPAGRECLLHAIRGLRVPGLSCRRPTQIDPEPRRTRCPPTMSWHCGPSWRDLARRRARWGWRWAPLAAKAPGWRANPKRVHRLWIAEGLRAPYRKRKKPLRGIGEALGPFCPIRPNVVWALDFQFDQTSGRMLKILNVVVSCPMAGS